MKRCETCNQLWSYSDKFDAYFCKICNEWKENTCNRKDLVGDDGCDICSNRPEKPIPSKTIRNKK